MIFSLQCLRPHSLKGLAASGDLAFLGSSLRFQGFDPCPDGLFGSFWTGGKASNMGR